MPMLLWSHAVAQDKLKLGVDEIDINVDPKDLSATDRDSTLFIYT